MESELHRFLRGGDGFVFARSQELTNGPYVAHSRLFPSSRVATDGGGLMRVLFAVLNPCNAFF